MPRYQFLIVRTRKAVVLSFEAVSQRYPSFIVPSLSLLLMSFNLCSRSVWGGLDSSVRGSGSEKLMVPVFLCIEELIAVVCLRLLLLNLNEKTRRSSENADNK